MAAIWLKWRDSPSRGIARCRSLSGTEQIAAARREVDAREALLNDLDRPSEEAARLYDELQAARKKLDGLRFVWEDHAAEIPLSVRLRRINQRNAEFWRRNDEHDSDRG